MRMRGSLSFPARRLLRASSTRGAPSRWQKQKQQRPRRRLSRRFAEGGGGLLSRPEGDTTEEVDCERRANPDAGPSDDDDASCSALYSELYGVDGMSHLEEEAHLQMVFSLLGAGENVEREIEAAVDEGDIDGRTLAVVYHRLQHAQRESPDGDVDGEDGYASAAHGLALLYSRMLTAYEKRRLSPHMKLLDEALDVMLDEDVGDETARLIAVSDLLRANFVGADLEADPLALAHYLAQAETDPAVMAEVDAYYDARLQREDFVYQVEERLAQVEAEFARLDGGPKGGLEDGEGATKDPAAASPADWIDQVEQETLRQSERSHRDTVLKYIRYIVDVARQV